LSQLFIPLLFQSKQTGGTFDAQHSTAQHSSTAQHTTAHHSTPQRNKTKPNTHNAFVVQKLQYLLGALVGKLAALAFLASLPCFCLFLLPLLFAFALALLLDVLFL